MFSKVSDDKINPRGIGLGLMISSKLATQLGSK